MKTLSKIKLNQFSKAELEQRALNSLKGGQRRCDDICDERCEVNGQDSVCGTSSLYHNYGIEDGY